MTQGTEVLDQYSGLILLTGVDRPGIAAALFESLSPFSILIIDVEQLVIADRLVLTVLFSLNPAHQKAIEQDLELCAKENNIDIATLFESRTIQLVKRSLVEIQISGAKLHPATIAIVSKILKDFGANIDSITKKSAGKNTITLTVSNSTFNDLNLALTSLSFEDGSVLSIKVCE